ncbi:nickel/cobalt transporter [Stagnihabitans tardus]|uniref:Nickel/cobalt efflux system n=1 Tax=Stagnihabitans tardus TaxID=2699202 RepID=A0AAE4YAR0_9RHOB|nr:hypothetical protein [Stagnihabitans tardus]NBZ89172.1 hypothetical protein [Stagnihabitans tardus]
MRFRHLAPGLAVVAVLLAIWAAGGLTALESSAIEAQRQMQDALAEAIRHIKRQEPGAMAGLLGLCFTYGVLHAVGPGHGKVLIGGYGLGQRVPWLRLSVLAVAASLAQAATAVGLVFVLVGILGWKRDASQAIGTEILSPLGAVVIGLLGLWLVWRGGRRAFAPRAKPHDHHHDHDHDHDHSQCSHAHAPSLEEVEKLHSLRDAVVLILGIALRPCTGALLLLILTWQLGIATAGIAGAFAMGLGTATVTVGVAVLAVFARESALSSLPGQLAARTLPWIEMLAGIVVVLIAYGLYAAPA